MEDVPETKAPPKPAKWFGVRHEQYVLLVIATVVSYGIRTVFNVAVIAMISDDPPNSNIPTYPEWTDKKNTMLSSFFWGYVCFQIGAGQLAKKYGPKLFLGTAIFICSLATILLPVMGDKLGYGGIIACRVIEGLSQGFLYPSIHNLLSAWVPIVDRATIGSFVYTGGVLGNVIAMPIAGGLSASSIGWPSAFYVYGGLGLAWCVFWYFLGSDCPAKHSRISEEERRYVADGASVEEKESVPTPWRSIFTSLPFLAILVAHAGQCWGFWTLLTEIPSYMERVLKFKIASNSLLSALPYLVLWLLSYVMSPLADILVTKKFITRSASRKIFNSIGLMGPAVALFALDFVGSTQKEVTIFLLVLAVGLNAGVYSGFHVNHIDISPTHSGTLMGITNSLSNTFSIPAPIAVDAVRAITGYEETDKALWNVVFTIAGVIYLVTATFYIIFGSAVVQPWDNHFEATDNSSHTRSHSNDGSKQGKSRLSREVSCNKSKMGDLPVPERPLEAPKKPESVTLETGSQGHTGTKWFGVRHEQYILYIVVTVIAYGIRTAFNVAIIAMIDDDPPNNGIPTYPDWASQKNIMLSSFFWGYVCFQVGAGQLAKNYGPKLFLGTAIFICSLATILLPLMGDKLGYGGVIACRVIEGLSQGFLFPSLHNLLSAWVPIVDRATIGSFVYTGGPLGNVIAMPIAGMLSASSIGWPSVFYLYGGLGLVWCVFWYFLAADCPAKHSRMTEEERRYVEDGASTEEKDTVPTPWMSIFTSLPFLAILVAHSGQNWGFWTLLTEIPSYMESILKFKIASNSMLSALPYLVLWLLSYLMSPLADILVTRQVISRTASRKIFNSIGLMVPALALFALNFVGSTQKEVTIFILVVAVGFNAGVYSGFNVNHIDISPVHSGTLMGITNSLSNVFSIIAPLAVDAVRYITGYKETEKALWNLVFSIAGIIYVVTATFYIFFGSGEVQPWDNLETVKDNFNNTNKDGSKQKNNSDSKEEEATKKNKA
ncbi:hypothetical protein NQ315_001827 [Exocentrus adspersus]|uniref:Putative inorganic phosphate cotransporter n=1 Tax=Exocentrus adspersus TaxID=1586481 RepID=A0AAV8WB60_9CUCU|nr:hypothetical protein NQ315_001827 [Exocentrus adspersus]